MISVTPRKRKIPRAALRPSGSFSDWRARSASDPNVLAATLRCLSGPSRLRELLYLRGRKRRLSTEFEKSFLAANPSATGYLRDACPWYWASSNSGAQHANNIHPERRARNYGAARCSDGGGHAGFRASPASQAQHPLHYGRRHRLDAAENLSPRPDGRRNAQHRSHRPGGCDLHGLLRRGELHRRADCLLHRHASPARRNDPAPTAWKPDLPIARYPSARGVPA